MLNEQMMAAMDDKHLVSAADAEIDSFTSTALERELLKRLDRLVDERDQYAPLVALMDKKFGDTSPDYIEEIFTAMDEFGCDDHIDLRAKLERADKFYDIASDAGDVIERLSSLINNTR
jgi:hypothetical protein